MVFQKGNGNTPGTKGWIYRSSIPKQELHHGTMGDLQGKEHGR